MLSSVVSPKTRAQIDMRNWFRLSKSGCRCGNYEGLEADEAEIATNGRLWEVPVADYLGGQFSTASVCSSELRKDRSQVDRAEGAKGIFFGLYNGGGEGSGASQFLLENIMKFFVENVRKLQGYIAEQALERAIADTESGFITHVFERLEEDPLLVTHGSCCLTGLLWDGNLQVANLGDSKAVLGYYNPADKLRWKQLTQEHSLRDDKVRNELRSKNPECDILICGKDGAWSINGLVQVSRSIGYLYLKYPKHQSVDGQDRYNFKKKFTRPILRSDADTFSLDLKEEDCFLILATRSLWDHLSNNEAVKLVHENKRKGSAKRLIAEALRKASSMKTITCDEILTELQGSDRQSSICEISAVVIFFQNGPNAVPRESFVAFEDQKLPSRFGLFAGMDQAV